MLCALAKTWTRDAAKMESGSLVVGWKACRFALVLLLWFVRGYIDLLTCFNFSASAPENIGSVLLDVLFILLGYSHMWFVYAQLLRQFSSYHSMESGGTEKYYLALARGEAGSVWVSLTANALFQDPRWLRWQKAANRPVGKSTDKEARKVTSDLAKAESDKCAAAEHGT